MYLPGRLWNVNCITLRRERPNGRVRSNHSRKQPMSTPLPTIPEPEPRPESTPVPGPDLPGDPLPGPRPGEPVPAQRKPGISATPAPRSIDSEAAVHARRRIVRRRGDFLLVRSEAGFVWTLRAEGGETWYWHPGDKQWTLCPCTCATPERASQGLKADGPSTETRAPRRPVKSRPSRRPISKNLQ